MNELINLDGITPEVMACAYEVQDWNRVTAELNDLHTKAQVAGKVTLILAYEIGRRLQGVKDALNHGEFGDWIEQNMSFTLRTAQKYMKLYERYKNEPGSLLENESLRGAYLEAGIVKVSTPVKQSDGELYDAGADNDSSRDDYSPLFRKQTFSGIKLKSHRVIPSGPFIMVVRKEDGIATAVGRLYIAENGPDPTVAVAFQKAAREVCAALESYYKVIEDLEEKGLLPSPEGRKKSHQEKNANEKRRRIA